jgi:hypothetical protein
VGVAPTHSHFHVRNPGDAHWKGVLSMALICAACGYYECYLEDPGAVPFERMLGFRWINPPPPDDGPYR